MPSRVRTYQPDDAVTDLPFVGTAYAEKLTRLDIHSIRDLLFHFPFRYEDTSNISSIAELLQNGEGTIIAKIRTIANTRTRRGKWLTKAILEDSSGSIAAVWFNQPFLTKTLKKQETYIFNGKINAKYGTPNLSSPQYEHAGSENSFENNLDDTTHLGKLTPIYPETRGLSSKWIRARIKHLRPHIPDTIRDYLPEEVRKNEDLLDLASAVENLHFPETADDISSAKYRLGLDELIRIRVQAHKLLEEQRSKTGIPIKSTRNSDSVKKILESLPFTLTRAQETATGEIFDDIAQKHPMYRLLNGDVGSGKTIVALLGALAAYDSDMTTVFMAPTTILAQQHYESVTTFLSNADLDIPVTLMTSQDKHDLSNSPQILIGTHAIIYQSRLPSPIGLIIVDEQHRFGVVQRRKLLSMSADDTGSSPHYLTMTATPIPRTLTMALYGNTNVSILDELPEGRIPVQTHLVTKSKREDAYRWIENLVSEGQQIFVICPLVEESELVQAKSVLEEYERLKKDVFPELTLGLVHGQMKEAEKNATLDSFREKEYDILVATPVIEVGIDIPNATVIVIEDAERFGLAQLHQLRGRIGRGDIQSYCLLFTEHPSEEALKRLKYFSTHPSGFDVAEYDLRRRGPGEVYGTRQSGLLELRFADITDASMLKKADMIGQTLNYDL